MMKRHPPSFHHLPQARAKKLKKDWIVKQKTRSKWKTQKRREGIVTQRDALSCSAPLSDPRNAPQSSVDQGAPVDETISDHHDDESSNSPEDEPALTKSKQNLRRQEEGSTSAGPSLRELQKQAYSPATLHHHKSRPLHHPKGRMALHGRTFESSRKRDVRGGSRGLNRRGGQPDMRLRMSAMLEKIKRDYS